MPQCKEQGIGEGCKQNCVVHSKVLELPDLGPCLIAYRPEPPPLETPHPVAQYRIHLGKFFGSQQALHISPAHTGLQSTFGRHLLP